MDIQRYQSTLEQAGVIFRSGLSLREVDQIEAHYRFRFPPDYCKFLMNALPISNGFVDWRNAGESKILEMLSSPDEDICFDIEHNGFWLEAWGHRSAHLPEAFSIAKHAINQAPVLIPIFGHRYIPARPEEAGNPGRLMRFTGKHLCKFLFAKRSQIGDFYA